MTLSNKIKSSKKGFTLIELLVVIAIIATLGGLGYGPVMKHLQNADVTKAKKVCKDIDFAIQSYEDTYDSLPYTGNYPSTDTVIDTDSPAFLDVLMGNNTEINDKGKKFFTADEAKGGRSGLVYNGGNLTKLVDKWGNPYKIMIDYDEDDVLDATQIGSGKSYKKELNIETAIVASPGPDKIFDDIQDAKSW